MHKFNPISKRSASVANGERIESNSPDLLCHFQLRPLLGLSMTRVNYILLGVALFGVAFYLFFPSTPVPDDAFITLESGERVASFEQFLSLHSTDESALDLHLRAIEQGWHPGSATMLVEMTQSVKFHSSRKRILETLERKTGQSFGNDAEKWTLWLWNSEYQPHPQYGDFKLKLYGQIDPLFSNYYRETDNAKIRLDEIRWGGVMRDGIPPLKNPKMIAASSAEYLDDSNVVFGVSINGDSRCYPKRILAWHEMFKDTIGGQSVCGVY